MISVEKEIIKMKAIIDPVGKQVEDWMGEVENMMKMSVREELLKAVLNYKETRKVDWVFKHPGQCILNGS